jgi:hypothetical protein
MFCRVSLAVGLYVGCTWGLYAIHVYRILQHLNPNKASSVSQSHGSKLTIHEYMKFYQKLDLYQKLASEKLSWVIIYTAKQTMDLPKS